MEDIASLGLSVDSSQLRSGSTALKDFEQQAGKTERAALATERATSMLGRAMGLLGVAFSLSKLTDLTSAWTDLNSRMANAFGPENAASALSRVEVMARRTYSGLEQTAEGVLRNSQSMKELGYRQSQMLDYQEAINNALVISAIRGQRAESVQNALSKAMAGGKLKGQDLMTVLQQGGRVTKALADGLGVSTNELRKMGAEGKLTTDAMVMAFISQLGKLREEADAMPATLKDAFGILGDAILKTTGKIDQFTGSSAALAGAIIAIGDNINVIVPIVGGLATVFGVTLAPALWAATAAMLAFAASPIGLLAIGVGALASGLVYLWNEQRVAAQTAQELAAAFDANVEPLQQAKKASKEFREELKLQIDAQLEAANAALVSAQAMYINRQALANSLTSIPIFGQIAGTGLSLMNQFTGMDAINAALDNVTKLKKQQAEIEQIMTTPPGKSDPKRPADPTKDQIKAAKAYDKLTLSARQFIEQQQLEASVLGMTSEAANRLRHEQEMLNEAANQNIKLTPKQREEIAGLATAMAAAEEYTRKLTEAYDFGKQVVGSFFSDLKSNLMDGQGLWASFADAGANALQRIADKALSMAADGIWDMLFGALRGAMGGGFGGIGGGNPANLGTGIGFGIPLAKGGVFSGPGIGAYSSSIVSSPTVFPFARGIGLMGEAGPEAIMPLKRGPDGRLGVSAANGNVPAAGNDNPVPLEIHNHIHVPAGTNPETAPAIAREVAKELKVQLPDAMQAYNRNPLRRAGRGN